MPPSTLTHKVAYLPERRMSIVNTEWLDWLKGLGYTGLYLEFDPEGPIRSGNISQFQTIYRLISLYDLAWGAERHRLCDWINRSCELAHERGLKVYLSLWEPRIPGEAWGLFPVDWHGRGGYDRVPWNTISWCLSHPPATQAFAAMAKEAFASIRQIDGLKMGTHDNDAHLCTSACPRCKDVSKAQLIDRLFGMLMGAADASGLHRSDFDYVLYTWWWTKDDLDAVARHMTGRRVTVLGRSTQGLSQEWDGKELGKVFDLALGVPGIGEGFRNQLRAAQQRGWQMADMTAFGHTIEYFWLPYTPAPNLVAQKLVELRGVHSCGWFDYDCGGVYPGINTEVIRDDSAKPATDADELSSRTLSRLYPPDQLASARKAYKLAEQAVACRPIALDSPDVMILSGRNTVELVLAIPFDPGDISGMDQGHRIFWSAPCNFFTPLTTPTMLAMSARCVALWEEGWTVFKNLRGQPEWQATLAWEKQVFRTHCLAAGSAHRYTRMAANRLARARGELTAGQERDLLMEILQAELAAVEEFAPMWRADHRLLMNTNIRLIEFVQVCVPWIPIHADDPFKTKIDHTRAMLSKLRDDRILDAVSLHNQ